MSRDDPNKGAALVPADVTKGGQPLADPRKDAEEKDGAIYPQSC